MVYNIFSTHAPTGESEKEIVSTNEYSPEGRAIGYPSKFSVYTRKISSSDGSQVVVESRNLSDIVGNRLYLYHRPSINANGTVSTFTVSDGTLDTTLTNAKQGYVVFSSLPAGSFTISYLAVPDNISSWYFNTLQDDVMEIQKVLGVTNDTGYPGTRNIAYAIFDTPSDVNLSGVLRRAVYLSHLGSDITIGSSNDANLTGTLGDEHTIQLGRYKDTVIFDASNIYLQQEAGTLNCTVWLGNKTGDYIRYSGQITGEGPVTIGGPSWAGYSGTLGGSLTEAYYTGAMLRVNGNVAVLGGLQAVGSITIVNMTGEISTVYGDFTVTDNLAVYGSSVFTSIVDFNEINVNSNATIQGNIIAGNSHGAGGNGQTLIDGLDASEIAHSYKTLARKVYPNTVLKGKKLSTQYLPTHLAYTFTNTITGEKLCSDSWQITGFATASAGPSGSHPNVIQVNFADYPIPIVTGTYSTTGSITGFWSPGMMDPGNLWIRDLNTYFEAPIYGYSIQSGDSTYLYKLNVYCPEYTSNSPQTNDSLAIYNPNCVPYSFISSVGGASPTASILATSQEPFEVSFEDEVRKMTTNSSSISITTALQYSVSGIPFASYPTGVAYIFATNLSDPENAPGFKARSVPYAMPGETVIGEVKAYYSGSQWNILESVSYRPGAKYDSSWIPIVNYIPSGRALYTLSGLRYFTHDIGPSIDMYNCEVDIYLAQFSNTKPNNWEQSQPLAYTASTTDYRNGFGFSGLFTKLQVGNAKYSGDTQLTSARDASIAYIDGRYIGIDFDPTFGYALKAGSPTPSYLRVIVRRTS